MSTCRSSTLALIMLAGVAAVLAQDQPQDSATITSSGSSTTLEVDSGRPMLRAVVTLEQRYGYAITYEDPSYVYSDDVFDATKQVRRDHRAAGPGAPKILLPKASTLSMQVPGASCISPSQLDSVLQELVGLQGTGSRGGHFRVDQSQSGIFHVVPTEVRDRSGNWAPQASPLDARISFPAEPRTEVDLLATIASMVSAATHLDVRSIRSGIVIGIPSQHHFEFNIGADNETAREVLTQMLKQSPQRESWTLTNAVEMSPNTYLLYVTDLPPSPCHTVVQPSPPPPPHVSGCMSCAGPPSSTP